MERISGGRQTHGEKRAPWEKNSHGESFGENCGSGGGTGNGTDHSCEDDDVLTSGRYGSGD